MLGKRKKVGRGSLTFPLDQNERVKVLENRWVEEEEEEFRVFFFLKVIFFVLVRTSTGKTLMCCVCVKGNVWKKKQNKTKQKTQPWPMAVSLMIQVCCTRPPPPFSLLGNEGPRQDATCRKSLSLFESRFLLSRVGNALTRPNESFLSPPPPSLFVAINRWRQEIKTNNVNSYRRRIYDDDQRLLVV